MREEAVGNRASEIAPMAAVRSGLLERQRGFRKAPGLVADGRDMGTVVFPDAALKIYLTATVQVRAQRRYKQLIDKGIHANLAVLFRELEERDRRDVTRAVAPLKPAADAVQIDSSTLAIDQVVDLIVKQYRERTGGKA
jgi:cytidylate kinase